MSEATAAPSPAAPRVAGLGCPRCGGALEADPGARVVVCPYCATPLLAMGEVGVRRFAVEPKIDASRAREAARGWLGRGWNKDPRLRREAKPAEAFLCFIPFYRVQADVVGYALGTEERRRTVGSGKNRRVQTYEVDVERPAQQSFDRTTPAVNVAEWGIRRVNLAGDRLVPFDPEELERRGMLFAATGSEADAKLAAIADFRQRADPARGLKRVRFSFLESLRDRLSVIFYPLWVVRYAFRGRSYQVLVDAEDGSLAFGKAPGNDFYRAAMLVAAEAAACFIGTSAVRWALEAEDSFELVIGAGAVALAILGWGWKRFRWGGEVVEGSGCGDEPEAGGVRAFLQRLGKGGG